MNTATRDPGSPVVLLVEPDQTNRQLYGAWLEEAGMTPINCPGPRLPGFVCLGTCNRPCPLADVADVAVLDTCGLPGISKKGLPAWRLLRYYLAQGKPVVVIADHYRKDRSFRPEQVAILRPNPGPESLLLMVKAMLKEAQRW
ncbi:MAG TPA: hypothetical protein VFR68_10310 [Candidatus Dormibacteraeota bacterium]|nr:hypothetical protein [Candidatus Dormibacteraeota bacterium]